MFNIPIENLSLTISLVGLILSISNTIYLLYINRKSIDVSCRKIYDCSKSGEFSMFFDLIITNKSRLKLSISRVVFVLDNSKFDFHSFPVPVYNYTTKSGNTVTSSLDVYSKTFPQDIDALSSVSGLFEIENFPFEKFYNSDNFSLEIYTNRGLIIKHLPVVTDYYY